MSPLETIASQAIGCTQTCIKLAHAGHRVVGPRLYDQTILTACFPDAAAGRDERTNFRNVAVTQSAGYDLSAATVALPNPFLHDI